MQKKTYFKKKEQVLIPRNAVLSKVDDFVTF